MDRLIGRLVQYGLIQGETLTNLSNIITLVNIFKFYIYYVTKTNLILPDL